MLNRSPLAIEIGTANVVGFRVTSSTAGSTPGLSNTIAEFPLILVAGTIGPPMISCPTVTGAVRLAVVAVRANDATSPAAFGTPFDQLAAFSQSPLPVAG